MSNKITAYTQTDNEFYPTPQKLVDKMLSGIEFEKVNTALEPSAGKGDIADALKKRLASAHWRWDDKSVGNILDCVEIDPNLRHILTGKGYRVVHDDFLTFRTHKKYDLIVMNPPFSNGDLHLLKALELMQDGGTVVCLLNAETIRNCYSNSRKLLFQKLSELNAQITYLNDAFRSAERSANVDVALVKVEVPCAEKTSFIFENLKKKTYEEIYNECTDIVSGDFIAQIVKQYEMEVEGGIRLIREYMAMVPYILSDLDADAYTSPMLTLKMKGGSDYSSFSTNEYVEAVRLKYWNALFRNKMFTGQLTSNLQKKLYEKVDTLIHYDFSVFNIQQIQLEVFSMIGKGVEDAILGLFDKLSAEHSWYPECQKNIHYYSGWATNKAHKINKKVIIPIHGAFSSYSWERDRLQVNTVYEVMRDLEKALSYLDTGTSAVDESLWERLSVCSKNGTTRNIPLKYFEITLYKKGTCHIKFTNQDLLDKLNIYGSRRNGWLPPSYGKKAYKDMTQEEKTVIDDFQGAEEYEKVLHRSDYYLVSEMPQLLMIGAENLDERERKSI